MNSNFISEDEMSILWKYIIISGNIIFSEKDEVIFKYDEKNYKMIFDFIKKIKFIEEPIISENKRISIVSKGKNELQDEQKKLYSEDNEHKLSLDFKKDIPYCSDIIFVYNQIYSTLTDRIYRGVPISDKIIINNGLINCEIKIEDIIELYNSFKKNNFVGLDPQNLVKEYRENLYEEEWYNFIIALRALSEYSLVEQLLIRKDNNHIIKKNVKSKEPSEFDDNGNPLPQKNQDTVKYYYIEEDFEVILDFFRKIKFNEPPRIGTGKRVIISYEKDPSEYTSDQSHIINLNKNPYYPNIIYILDKIKDLMMHVSDGKTNYNFYEDLKNYKVISFRQTRDDFSIDCEIQVEDIIQLCNYFKKKYQERVFIFPSESVTKIMQANGTTQFDGHYEEWYLNNAFNSYMKEELIDLYTYAYLCLLAYDSKDYFILFDEKTYGLDWKVIKEDHLQIMESILGIAYEKKGTTDIPDISKFKISGGICGLISLNKFRKERLLNKQINREEKINKDGVKEVIESETYFGILWDIKVLNKQLVEFLRNARAHMHINSGSNGEYIQFVNSLRNSSIVKRGDKDNPNFEMIGYIDSFRGLFYNIETSYIEASKLYDDLNTNNMSNELLSCIEQINQLLSNFVKYKHLTEYDIEDKELLYRYHKLAEVAEHLIQINALDVIITKLYSPDITESENKSR